ncbi:MAG: hypothetical protein JO317_03415, partial [Verrucomicrobiae bacterium]|nr:hypothetical protein [Verrucomicrobiae bacterium]
RSPEDVSLRRLVNFTISTALKNAFEQVYGSPFIVKLLFAEIGASPEEDYLCTLNYDGAFASVSESHARHGSPFTAVGGTKLSEKRMRAYFEKEVGSDKLPLGQALQRAVECWQVGFSTPANADKFERDHFPSAAEMKKQLKDSLKHRQVEAALLRREGQPSMRFQRIDEAEVRKSLKHLVQGS